MATSLTQVWQESGKEKTREAAKLFDGSGGRDRTADLGAMDPQIVPAPSIS